MKLNCPSSCPNVTGSESGGLPVARRSNANMSMITPIKIVLFHEINKNKYMYMHGLATACTCSILENSVEVHQHLALNLEQHSSHHPR